MRFLTSNLVRTWLQPVLALTVLIAVISFGKAKPKAQSDICSIVGGGCMGSQCTPGPATVQWAYVLYGCWDSVTGNFYYDAETDGCCLNG